MHSFFYFFHLKYTAENGKLFQIMSVRIANSAPTVSLIRAAVQQISCLL